MHLYYENAVKLRDDLSEKQKAAHVEPPETLEKIVRDLSTEVATLRKELGQTKAIPLAVATKI